MTDVYQAEYVNGRVSISKSSESLGLKNGDTLLVVTDNGKLIMKKIDQVEFKKKMEELL